MKNCETRKRQLKERIVEIEAAGDILNFSAPYGSNTKNVESYNSHNAHQCLLLDSPYLPNAYFIQKPTHLICNTGLLKTITQVEISPVTSSGIL